MIPDQLEDWTLDVVSSLIKLGEVEGDRHDFKAVLPRSHELTKLACAFANSHGGFVVVGVAQSGRTHHYLKGVAISTEIAADFGQRIHAVPTITFHAPKCLPLVDASTAIYVFHVPASPRRPHIPEAEDERAFWKRTNRGCVRMTLEEVRAQIVDFEERRERLKLLLVELLQNREVLLQYPAPEGRYLALTLDYSLLDRVLVDSYPVIQDDPVLVGTLMKVRQLSRAANTQSEIFFRQVGLPLSSAAANAIDYNTKMHTIAVQLIQLIDLAVNSLSAKFGVDADELRQIAR